MINFRLVVIIVLIIASALVGVQKSIVKSQSPSDHPQDPPDTKDGLELLVEVKDTVVRLNSSPQITVRLKNVSDKPITIYKNLDWGQSKGLSLFIEAIHGKLDAPTFLAEARYSPPFPKEDFVTIQPGEFVESKRLISWELLGVKEAGEYRIIVRYRSPIPKDFAPAGLEIWGRENGALRTKPLDLKVTE